MKHRVPSQPVNPPGPPCQGGANTPSPDFSSPDKGRLGGVAFIPYDSRLTALARENRKNPTPAEQKMWREVLRSRQFAHYKFLRQKPIDRFIVDFYCSELRWVIEIDGESHAETAARDEERTKIINARGLRVIRYSNAEVMQNIEGVYRDLLMRLEQDRRSE